MSTLATALTKLRERFSRPADLQVTRMPTFELPPGLERVRDMAVAHGLKKLFTEKSFYVNELEKLLALSGIVPDGDLMKILHVLHCTSWQDMHAELRTQVAGLIIAMFTAVEGPAEGGAS